MKLWNEIPQGELVFGYTEFQGVALDPLEEVDGPAAGDIVGNLDHLDFLVFHRGKEYIIHVDEPNRVSAWTWGDGCTTYRSPFWRSTTPFLRTKPWRQTTAPTPVTEKSFDSLELARFTAWNSAPQVSICQGGQGLRASRILEQTRWPNSRPPRQCGF